MFGRGDIDGDGYADLLMTSSLQEGVAHAPGRVYLVPGPTSGALPLSLLPNLLSGESMRDFAGSTGAIVSDTNGDGLDDLVVGASGADPAGSASGTIYLLHGPVPDGRTLAGADARIDGDRAGTMVGWSVAGAGDVDGDSLEDLLLGGPGEGHASESAGDQDGDGLDDFLVAAPWADTEVGEDVGVVSLFMAVDLW